MHQVTLQDYRDAFINEHLPLSTIRTHRSVIQSFTKQSKQYGFNLTTRNVFDFLMFNANADSRSRTFGEVSDVHYSEIANYLNKKERTIENEILKLVRAGLVERHPTKRRVFIIPSMTKARDDIIEQVAMKKQMKVTEKAEARLADLEEGGLPITPDIRRRVYADETAKAASRNGKGTNGKHTELPLPFE